MTSSLVGSEMCIRDSNRKIIRGKSTNQTCRRAAIYSDSCLASSPTLLEWSSMRTTTTRTRNAFQ
eukprot:9841386-Prorocentrum_lima.AAC.1